VPAAEIDHFGVRSEVGFEERSALQAFRVTFGEFLRVSEGFWGVFWGFSRGFWRVFAGETKRL
jgi:hypothetical protein